MSVNHLWMSMRMKELVSNDAPRMSARRDYRPMQHLVTKYKSLYIVL